jgi:hypothetical protein
MEARFHRGGFSVANIRRAKLDPKFRSLYPELPAGQWIPAWQATTRRAERVWRQEGAEALIYSRLLAEEHFRFQGGDPRPAGWCVIPERLTDPTQAELPEG